MIFNRLHPLHLCSLVRRFSGPVRKFATRAARVLTENPPARNTEFSLGTAVLDERVDTVVRLKPGGGTLDGNMK